LSLLDSCSKYSEYVDLAVAQGMKAIASTEHGLPRSWIEKKDYCDSKGIKFIYGVEAYTTYSFETKQRDNMHVVLLARNKDGFHEINRLMGLASQPDHFYYAPRISLDELLNISPNVIKISACLASPLSRLEHSDPRYMEVVRAFDYLEIQHHSIPAQVEYNKWLLKLSQKTGIPLIAGTDTHSSSKIKAEARDVLLEYKEQVYADESGWDLVWKTEDELIEAYEKQNAIPRNAFMSAIQMTNTMAESVEDWSLDKRPKYPILYGSPEADEAKLHEVTWRMLDEKLESGVIPREQEEEFRKDIAEEFDAFHQTNMGGFMLSMHEIVGWCRAQGIPIGPSRGSVSGSRIAYVTEITDLNPVQWHTNFSRFCNKDRVSLGDIDVDCIDSDRPKIFEHIIGQFGADKCARVAAYGTIADLSFIDDCGGGLAIIWEREHHPEKFKENGRMDKVKYKFDQKNPYNPLKLQAIKKEYKENQDSAREKYPDLFYYEKAMVGTRVSQSVHPAGMVICCEPLDENWGVFNKDGERCLFIDMNEASAVNLVKYDLLILKTIQVISDCYKLLGLPYPRMHEINFCDKDVWKDVCKDQQGIFQFESEFAADAIRKFKPVSIEEITVANAALRPGSASYRDELFARKRHKNPTELLDKIFWDSYGFCVYQEQTIEFLQKACGLSASYADTIRRAISKKKRDKIDAAMPEILEGYCKISDKPHSEAEEEAKVILQVIEDSSLYSFNYNHAVGYSLLSYMCAYLRYYYPEQFIASYLKNAANDDDINTGRAMAKSRGIRMIKPKFRQDNRTFYIDTVNHTISDALSSIKGVGLKDAEALWSLKDRTYGTFVELLRDMTLYSGALNTAVIDKLIKLDYFSEFGSIKRLLHLYDEFYNGPHCFKSTLVPASQQKRMAELIALETGDDAGVLGFLSGMIDSSSEKRPSMIDEDNPLDVVRYECELIGSPMTILPQEYKGNYAVLDVDTKYSPKIRLQSLTTGNVGMMKVLKGTFQKDPLKAGQLIHLDSWQPKQAYGKPGVMENWINKYSII
jgi:DNA polymerase-3 subunit alpha